MSHVSFPKQGLTVEILPGETLVEAVRRAGLALETPCDGSGTCGKCRVKATPHSALAPGAASDDILSDSERSQGWVLACQAQALDDLVVELEESSNDGMQILRDGHEADATLDPWFRKRFDGALTEVLAGAVSVAKEPGDTTRALFGLSVDIGTTTLVTALIDLRTGKELESASSLNPQARRAQDVLSRIKLGSESEGLELLRGEVIAEINQHISEVCSAAKVSNTDIWEIVFSGNTTMLHLATGVNPASLGKYPYTPALDGGRHLWAADLGLAIAGQGLVYLPPIMSAYVGADITSGMLATRLHEQPGVILFVDIGTNGEMALAVNGVLTATSTAAGPAFEGMNISCGMRANRGAIERVSLDDGEIRVKTIADAEPVGLCGSGLLDAVGELAHRGGVDANGRFRSSDAAWPWRSRWVALDGKTVFRLAGPVYLSQKDIRQVQLAKAAVRAGIELMLKANNLAPAQVDRVLIAGSFGFHLKTDSLIHLGLLPREFQGRVEFVGNTSKSGGRVFLLDQSSRVLMKSVTERVRVLEMANDPAFEKTFVRAISF